MRRRKQAGVPVRATSPPPLQPSMKGARLAKRREKTQRPTAAQLGLPLVEAGWVSPPVPHAAIVANGESISSAPASSSDRTQACLEIEGEDCYAGLATETAGGQAGAEGDQAVSGRSNRRALVEGDDARPDRLGHRLNDSGREPPLFVPKTTYGDVVHSARAVATQRNGPQLPFETERSPLMAASRTLRSSSDALDDAKGVMATPNDAEHAPADTSQSRVASRALLTSARSALQHAAGTHPRISLQGWHELLPLLRAMKTDAQGGSPDE